MALPKGDEYQQAVQNPAICFSDAELKASDVETNPMGLPKPYSGGFTTTYKFKSSSMLWAVRCFTRQISDLEKRYQSIGNFQSKNNCPFLLEARFLPNGIRIGSTYHSVIKMKWLEGEPLNVYLERIHQKRNEVEKLLTEFMGLVDALDSLGIAHGDLQHGNILVKNGKLFLIDYDGMFLPDLANMSVNELGHPNFQHPTRTASHFDRNLDRFSAITIYTALKALMVAPSLWRKYENGENLLFKGQDFASPKDSALLNELASHSPLEKLVNNFRAVCSLEYAKIPSLKEYINLTISASPTNFLRVVNVRNAYAILDGSNKTQLLGHIGKRVEVVGKVTAMRNGRTSFGDPYLFVNFGQYPHQTFTIVLWSNVLQTLKSRDLDSNDWLGRYVSVIGVMSTYSSKPQISLDAIANIQILNKDDAQSRLTGAETSKMDVIATEKPIEERLNEFYKDYPITMNPKGSPLDNPPSTATEKERKKTLVPTQKPKPSSLPPYSDRQRQNPLPPTGNPKPPVRQPIQQPSDQGGCAIYSACGISGAMAIGIPTQSWSGAILGILVGLLIGLILLSFKK